MSYCEADLPVVFTYAKCWFSHDVSHIYFNKSRQ